MTGVSKHHSLLAVVGISPAIITEAFYKLHIDPDSGDMDHDYRNRKTNGNRSTFG